MTFAERKSLVERSYRAWGSGDLETLFEIYHPDCEWDNRRLSLPDVPAVCRGHAEMAVFNRTTVGVLAGILPTAREMVELPDGRLLVAGTWGSRGEDDDGRHSVLAGIPPFGQIVEFRDDLIFRVEYFASPDEAREAAGMS